MPAPSTTHLVLIPSYNPGRKVLATVRAARAQWTPVWVGDRWQHRRFGRLAASRRSRPQDPGLRVLVLPENQGKGSAVLHGITVAAQAGLHTRADHGLRRPASRDPDPRLHGAPPRPTPGAMVLGKPVFGPEAPALRVNGRKVSNAWANLETLGMGIGDSLYGFRVYPIAPLMRVMHGTRFMRRFDFDPEAVVRLCWAGVRPVNIDAPVRYFSPARRGRFALQIPARQRAADLDAHTALHRLRAAPSAAAVIWRRVSVLRPA